MSPALSAGGSSLERTSARGRRGSHGINNKAPPPGSSLSTPTTAPRRREGSNMPTTLAVARSSGRSPSLNRRRALQGLGVTLALP